MTVKTCSRCGQEKTLSEFSKHKGQKDGLQSYCKVCAGEYRKQYYAANKEKLIAQGVQYYIENKEERDIYQKQYCAANKEKLAAGRKRWYAKNQERLEAYQKRYYIENKKERNAYNRKNRAAHPEQNREQINRRRARKLGAEGTATTEQIQARIEFYGGLCYLCGKPYEAVDHTIPLAKGGSNWPANLRPICKSCNSSKGVKWPFIMENI